MIVLFIISLFMNYVNCSSWHLSTDTRGNQFFNDFIFLTSDVKVAMNLAEYDNLQDATNSGLLELDINNPFTGSIRLNVDTSQQSSTFNLNTRKSVRMHSKATYGDGIYVLDINHFPSGCGVWPAFWTRSRESNSKQEIDIIENINNLSEGPIMVLHSDQSCTLEGVNKTRKMLGSLRGDIIDCQEKNDFSPGCVGYYINQERSSQNASQLGQNGRTIIVMQRDFQITKTVQSWAFENDNYPENLLKILKESEKSLNGQSNSSIILSTDQWQKPNILFSIPSSNCQEDWKNHFLVLNTALCGAWAENSYGYSGCSKLYKTCENQIINYPQTLLNAFWSINSITIFAGNEFDAGTSSTSSTNSFTHNTTSSSADHLNIFTPFFLIFILSLMLI